MDDSLIKLFIDLITSQTGLHVRDQDRSAFWQKILTRLKALKLAVPQKYYQLLTAKTPESQSEWRELVRLLTVNESYFMRDKGQLSLLKTVILPELIAQKINLHQALGIQPTLRIWSAGCSTGEEPYSLAIILKELIADLSQWKVFILGTDIDREALEKGKQGIYRSWSFRLVDAELQRRYFKQHHLGWEIDTKLRQYIEFGCVNLVTDNFPNIYRDIHNMDLIVCRNVFVYFEPKYISLVVRKFAKTLRPGGYLMTGHAEVHSQIMKHFQQKIFPESVVYQAKDAVLEEFDGTKSRAGLGESNSVLDQWSPAAGSEDESGELIAAETIPASCVAKDSFPETTPLLTTTNPLDNMVSERYFEDSFGGKGRSFSRLNFTENVPHKNAQMLIIEAKKLFKKRDYVRAIELAQAAISLQEYNFEAYYLIAQIHANLGNYDRATACCQEASQIDSMSVFPYCLQADIAEEQGDLETTKVLLKKVIYLAPSFVSAYIKLGQIYQKEGKLKRALKMYDSSCEILKQLPPNTQIDRQGKMTASQVLMDVKKILLTLYIK